jgi:Holliday junction resolvase-like predicted endonuclease
MDHLDVGKIGEDTAARFLVKQGFMIVERNYWKKYGEIDIVAKKKGVIHFVEVKTVSCELNKSYLKYEAGKSRDVSRETWWKSICLAVSSLWKSKHRVSEGVWKPKESPEDTWLPADNVHPMKLKRLGRAIQAYVFEKNLDTEWEFDVVTVYLDMKRREAKVEALWNEVVG